MSTYRMGESVSQKAMVGMFPSAASLIGCRFKEPPQVSGSSSMRSMERGRGVNGVSDLVVRSGVGEDEETGLTEGGLELVGEGPGRVAAGDGVGAGVLGELEDGPLAVGPRGLDDDVLGVLDGDDDPRRQLKLLPRLAQIDDEDACGRTTISRLLPEKPSKITARDMSKASLFGIFDPGKDQRGHNGRGRPPNQTLDVTQAHGDDQIRAPESPRSTHQQSQRGKTKIAKAE